jgi:5-methylcytosine-specific restriction endonuclease McrA
MADDFEATYEETLARAERIVNELNSVKPGEVTRENWEQKLDGYMQAVAEFESHETELYAAVFEETSGKGRIREYLTDKIGEPVESEMLARISGISEYARRVRELRNEEGFVIDSTRTRAELGQNDYFVVEVRDVDEKSRISAQTRYEQLQCEEACRICGRTVDHVNVKYMEVDHIESFVDYDDPEAVNDSSNLRTLCNECHHGKSASENIANRRRGSQEDDR